MNGGVYLVTVDATAKQNDGWYASNGFKIGGTATLTVNTINIPGTGVPAGMRLPILTVANGQTIVGDFATKNVTYAPGMNYRTGLAGGGLNYLLGT